MRSAEQTVRELFTSAGIEVNGSEDHDIQVYDKAFFQRVLADKSLGFGETYMDGMWDSPRLDITVEKLIRTRIEDQVRNSPRLIGSMLKAKLLNLQTIARAQKDVSSHYDIGNDLYEAMLDPLMIYSCAFWEQAHTLQQAQNDKLELICQKLELKGGERLLDIGCGWGGLAMYAAENFGVEVVGVTLSKNQLELGQERTNGLPIELRLQDYRYIDDGPFDKIVSVGMIEHVGYKNYPIFMQKAHDLLKDDGLFLLHTIGNLISKKCGEPFIMKYIFPNALTPSEAQLDQSSEGLFVKLDAHNIGPDYGRTLGEWHKKFSVAWPQLKDAYGSRFKRMWNFYLLGCKGSFDAESSQLWQFVYSKGNIHRTYHRPDIFTSRDTA